MSEPVNFNTTLAFVKKDAVFFRGLINHLIKNSSDYAFMYDIQRLYSLI